MTSTKKNGEPLRFDLDVPPRIDVPELIDDSSQPYADFRASMTDVRLVNRFLGGVEVVVRQAGNWMRAARDRSADAPVTFLDVATGSGDLPEALLARAHQLNVPTRVVGLDFSAPILRFAHESVREQTELRLIRGDAFRLPAVDRSYDYALCSLAFHHFSPEQCLVVLQEMERVSRYGWLVNDIRRARSAWFLISALTRLTGANRLTLHDAPASVLRAYTPAEFLDIARQLPPQVASAVHLKRSLFYRMALIREKIL